MVYYLLSGIESFFLVFLGALDLITTSRDVLSVDLAGVVSFRHLSSQLSEIQSIIGKMLLGDFQTYISEQIHRLVSVKSGSGSRRVEKKPGRDRICRQSPEGIGKNSVLSRDGTIQWCPIKMGIFH